MTAEPEDVGEQIEGALTGRVGRPVNWFLAFMAFIFGLGIGMVIGLYVAYLIVEWAANYPQAPLPTTGFSFAIGW